MEVCKQTLGLKIPLPASADMTRKKSGAGLGNSLANDRRKRAEQGYKASGVPEAQANRSVLEQTSLDDFIAKAEHLVRSGRNDSVCDCEPVAIWTKARKGRLPCHERPDPLWPNPVMPLQKQRSRVELAKPTLPYEGVLVLELWGFNVT